jgi:hypothetical protein
MLGRDQHCVRDALEAVRQALPLPPRDIDSNKGSDSVMAICFATAVRRPFSSRRDDRRKKDDNPHIEQKSWTHVRRPLGYVRYDVEAAREVINDDILRNISTTHSVTVSYFSAVSPHSSISVFVTGRFGRDRGQWSLPNCRLQSAPEDA